MTRLTLLFLCFCPVLAHAQANATKDSSLVASSESSPVSPASTTSFRTSSPPPSAANVAIVSRIVPPKLIHTIVMKDDGNRHVHLEGRRREVMVELTVNEHGQPTDLHIPEPVEDALDVEVLATVGKFRYQPGTLNGKPAAMPVRVRYVVPVGAIY